MEEGDFVNLVRKPTWQQATALVSLSTCGAMTGFAFAHGTIDDMTSPTRMPVHLLALKKPAKPVSANDSALRSAIVNVANYYLRMAQTKSPAEMEAIIWEKTALTAWTTVNPARPSPASRWSLAPRPAARKAG